MLLISSLVAGLSAAPAAYAANTKEYVSICDSGRLRASERASCRAKFKAAKADADRTAIFKEFSEVMDGKRMK